MRNLLFFFFTTCLVSTAYAQAPVIQKIDPETTFPNDTIVISGNGFSDNQANLEVWFDDVRGTILSSSDYAIEVVVPPQAKLSSIEVINKTSRLSGKSKDKFMPSFGGGPFNAANFSGPVTFSAPEELWDLCTCDFNTDGKPDLVSTKFSRPSSVFTVPSDIMVLQNQSTPGVLNAGSFIKLDKNNLPVLNVTFPTDNAVCGDLQGDGKPELIVTRAGSPRNSLHIFRNTSTTSINFAPQMALFMDVGHFATRMAIRDLNKDGKPEIIATNSFNDIFYIFINTSTGGTLSFNSTPLKLSIKVAPTDALTTYETDVQDFNGDNLPDIIINQFQTKDFYILKNTSTGSITFAAPQKVALEGALNRLTSADFNKDGLLDLVITSTLSDRADVLINQSTPATFAFAPPIVLPTALEPWGVDVSDIDGDRDADIIITNKNRQAIVASELKINVFINSGTATPTFTSNNITTATPTRNVKVTDLDGDGKPDIAFTGFSESTATAVLGIMRNTNCHQPDILNETPLSICVGQSIRLNTIPANNVTFVWEEISGAPAVVGGNDPFIDITSPGTYRVTATGESGSCVLSNSVVVAFDNSAAPADPVITSNDPLCSGKTLNLSTTATGVTYEWTGPNGFTSTVQNPSKVVTSGDAGFYSLQVKNVGGQCKSNVVTKRVDIADLADFAITSSSPTDKLCAGSSATLTVNNLANHTFQWRKNGVDIGGQTTAALTVSTGGAYTVLITNTELNCNVETDPLTLTFLTAPVAAYSVDQTACVGEALVFTNQSQVDAQGTAIYTWTFGDTQTSTETSPVHTYNTAQSFLSSLNVKYNGVSGCQNTISKTIAAVNRVTPVIAATEESICPDEQVTLSVAGTFASITWSTTATTPAITVGPGAYGVTTVDVNGCTGEDDIDIVALEVPEMTAIADPSEINAGNSSQLVASGASDYLWAPGKTLSDSTISSPKASPVETTTYTVTGTSTTFDANGDTDGCTAQAQVTLSVEGIAGFPVAFSPNGDGQNEIWDIQANSNPNCIISIFDGRGRKIFEGQGENWDGTYQGKAVPEGTYYYVYGCPDRKPMTGNVLLFR